MANERLQLSMNLHQAIYAMTGGNPGAIAASVEIVKNTPVVDPDDGFAEFGPFMSLDTLGIWDSDIYILWDRVCHRDVPKMLAILRAWQLGQLAGCTEEAIKAAIRNNCAGLDLDAIMTAVQERLPLFNLQQAPA